jgi:hypothetical protein
MWIIGKTKLITWSTDDFYYIDENDSPQPDSIKLEISHDGGSSWSTIIADTPNNGSYSWVIAGPVCSNAIIKFSGVYNTEITAQTTEFSIIEEVLTSIVISPSIARININKTRQFTAIGYDQENDRMQVTPSFVWNISGGQNISPNGLFTAGPTIGGPYIVTVEVGELSDTANVYVINNANNKKILLLNKLISN